MKKMFFCYFYLFLSLAIFSCSNENKKSQNNRAFENSKIVILSPYGCYQEIEFNFKGEGYLKTALYSGSILDGNVKLDTIFKIDSFHIQDTQRLSEIHKILQSVIDTESVKVGFKNDTYRNKLFVNDSCKINVYGLTNRLSELLNCLIYYLPTSNEKCEFLSLFKKAKNKLIEHVS
jgi:hypothetical protein